MRLTGPLRPRASGVFFFVLAVIVVLGAASVWRLSFFRTRADELQERFARNTQYISDFKVLAAELRADEAASLVAPDPAQFGQGGSETAKLDALMTLSEHSYEHVVNGAADAAAYGRFRTRWAEYRRSAGQSMAAALAGRLSDARTQYLTTSRVAYDAASGATADLADLNLSESADLAASGDAAYHSALLMTIAAVGLAAMIVIERIVGAMRAPALRAR